MIQNIVRFTDQIITDNQQVVGIFRVRSLFEASYLIKVSCEESFPCIILLEQSEFVSDLDRSLKYLYHQIQQQGAVVGIGVRVNLLDEEALRIIEQCSYVQFDLGNLTLAESYKQTEYLAKSVHAEGGFLEVIIGTFVHTKWNSVFTDEFGVAEFVTKTHLDTLGFKVDSKVVGDLSIRGKQQIDYDRLALMMERSDVYGSFHGASLGSKSLQGVMKSIKHPYQEVSGITEHALTKLSSRGVRYMTVSTDLQYLYDLALALVTSRGNIATPAHIGSEYQAILKLFLRYTHRFFDATYQLSS